MKLRRMNWASKSLISDLLYNFYFKDVRDCETSNIRSAKCKTMLYDMIDKIICDIAEEFESDSKFRVKYSKYNLEILRLLKSSVVNSELTKNEFRVACEKVLESLPSRKGCCDKPLFKKSTIKNTKKQVRKLIKQ